MHVTTVNHRVSVDISGYFWLPPSVDEATGRIPQSEAKLRKMWKFDAAIYTAAAVPPGPYALRSQIPNGVGNQRNCGTDREIVHCYKLTID